ncbi:MAG: hypothetical protein GVY36_05685 [Verrucomicrobia bacterium]|jgi:hypothetical protein|nr:hypothetical protein [Verrucomicrobiota bacterium]
MLSEQQLSKLYNQKRDRLTREKRWALQDREEVAAKRAFGEDPKTGTEELNQALIAS